MNLTAKLFAKYAADPSAFRDDLIVDVNGAPKRFGDVMDEWQRDDFALLDPALRACNGRGKPDGVRMRAYLERPRGHSKTTDLAVMVVWAMAFASRIVRGYAFAADKDQAALLKDAMETIVRLNPWLARILDVQKNLIVNIAPEHPGSGSRMEIATSDVGSSYGILPDVVIADELTHWDGDGSLWHSLISSAAKRSNCLLVVISNAGFMESWQWSVRESARVESESVNGTWHFRRIDGPNATWMTEDRLAEQRRMLPGIAYARLWLNEWSAAGGDALSPEVIAAAFRDDVAPLTHAAAGLTFVGGLDLGISRDASAFVVLGVRRSHVEHGSIRLAHVRVWRPTKGANVNLESVEDYVADAHQRFGLRALNFDPWQAAHLASRLQAGSVGVHRKQLKTHATTGKVPMVEVPQSGPNLQRMASVLIESFNDYRVELFDHVDLRRDLRRFRVEERSYGFRLVSPRDEHGHGDVGTAFCLALLAASELAAKRVRSAGILTDAADSDTALDRAFARMREDSDRENEHRESLSTASESATIWKHALQSTGRI